MSARDIGEPGSPGFEAWLKRRRDGIAASEIAAVMGLADAFKSRRWVYYAKRGEIDDTEGSDRMALGRHCEPYILARFARQHPEIVVGEGGLYAADDPRGWQMATFDALAYDPERRSARGFPDPLVASVQAKTTSTWEHWGDEGSDDVPLYVFVQCVQEMDVGGFGTVWVPVLHLPDGRQRTYRIERDDDVDELIGVQRAASLDMLARIAAGDPPPVDAHPSTTRALQLRYPELDRDRDVVIPNWLRDKVRAAQLAADKAGERFALLSNELRERMGDARYAVDRGGDRVARREVYPSRRVSVGLLREQHPDIAAACTVTSEHPVNKLVVIRRPRLTEGAPCLQPPEGPAPK